MSNPNILMIWADELRADRPFFLHVSFPNPHHPFTVPEPYASMYKPEEMPEPLPPVTESVDATELQLGVFHGDSRIFVEGREADRVIGTPPANYSEYTTRNWQISKAIYYGMTTLMDDAIGRILDTLEETRLAENTIVVFLSDHGEYMGDHGFLGKGFYYDCVIRTPLIFAGPGIKCEPTQRLLAEVMAATDLSNGRRQSPVTPRRKAVVARQD